MAITEADYAVMLQLRNSGILPPKPAILELGESNWYGDVPLQTLVDDIMRNVADENRKFELIGKLKGIVRDIETNAYSMFDVVKVFYEFVYDYSFMTAVDLHGTKAAHALDLNQPIDLGRKFDIVLNIGTAEHVFNTYQFFKTIHDQTAPGGLMVHELPFHGWMDHGFYNFQPTFFFDLAGANQYSVNALLCVEIAPLKVLNFKTREDVGRLIQSGQIGKDVMIYAVLTKPQVHQEFKVPMQGYYFGEVSDELKQNWQDAKPHAMANSN